MAKKLWQWNGSEWILLFDDALHSIPSYETGDLKFTDAASAGTGFLACDGTSYLTADYPALSALIRPILGGASAPYFYVPDYRGRAACGTGTGSGLTARALGDIVGVESVTLTAAQSGIVAHNHTQNSHNHTQDSHTHTQNSHTHTQDAHGHTQDSHNHTQDSHNHTQNPHAHYNQNPTNGASGGSAIKRAGTAGISSSSTTATNQAATATNQAATATNQTTVATNQNTTATNQNTVAVNGSATPLNTAAVDAVAASAHTNMQPSMAANIFIKT